MKNKNTINKKGKWTRRAFIATGGLTGVGLVVGFGGYAYMKNAVKKYSAAGLGKGDSLNAWVRIAPDNTITLAIPRAEMGQGVYTALPQLIAEELEVKVEDIKVVHPQPESPYSNTFLVTQEVPNIFQGYKAKEVMFSFLPIIATGGSTSVIDAWNNLRYAGATARIALVKAAADKWEISSKDCYAENGQVINRKTKEKLSYGSLAAAASQIEVKELPTLKERKDFKVIGESIPRIDVPEKVDGNAIFGLDVRKEGMLFAAVRHPRTIGGEILKITNEEDIAKMPGVKKVFICEYGPAIVIADNTWRATNGVRSIEAEEDEANADISTESMQARMNEILEEKPTATKALEGDVDAIFSNEEGTLVNGTYHVPYLAHATMEPMNCTVLINDNTCECWVGHQAPSTVLDILSKSTGIPKENITVNVTYLGGGFGRRSEPDFVKFAAAAAKEMQGIAVQTVFTREEDMQNDTYRPMASCKLKAKVDSNGEILAFESKSVLQSTSQSAMARIMPSMATKPKNDATTAEGLEDLPYIMQNKRVTFGDIQLPIQVGFWRSVGYSQNSFFAESFMDECAYSAGKDPFLFRKNKLSDHPRHLAVLDKVAAMSNWNEPLEDGKARGMALVKSYNSIVGEVVELTHIEGKKFKINKVYCALDCGTYVNPDIIDTQMQSGIVYGLTAALYGEITWDKGAVQQLNFPQYEMVRMNVCPEIKVEIMEVDAPPGGVGEPSTPPIAPALANAIFAATGERVRSLPLRKHGYEFV